MRNQSLKQRILGVGVIVSIMVVALIIMLVFYLRQNTKLDIEGHNSAIVESLSRQIELHIDVPMKMVLNIDCLVPVHDDISNEMVTQYLETIVSAYDYFQRIQLIDEEGDLQNIAPYDESLIGNSLVYAPYFQEGVEGEIYWSKVFISTTTHEPTISATIKKEHYYVVVDLDVNKLADNIDISSYFSEIEDLTIVDQWGTYIVSEEKKNILQRLTHPMFDVQNPIRRVDVNGNEVIFDEIESMGWYVVSTFNQSEIYKSVNRLSYISFSICFFFAIFIQVAVRGYFRKVDQGILELQRRTHQIINSNYQVVPFEFSFDEFRQLAHDFEVMNEEIMIREEEIKGFNKALEVKITERTMQLQETNMKLEEEIHERAFIEEELKQVNENLDVLVKEQTIELVKANQVLEENIRIAEEANNAKSHFLAIMSHEMRTPLNGIIGFLQMLHLEVLDTRNRELIDIISHSSKILLSLVNDVLDVSKYEANKGTYDEINVNLYKGITAAMEPYKKMASQRQLDFNLKLHGETELWVEADPTKIEQLFTNIVSNALKFTKVGFITVECDVKKLDKGYHLNVTVEDSGIGIKEEVKPFLFKPFAQADESIASEFGGTGLGLTICKNIVNHYGGYIDFDSDYGVGTTFKFDLFLKEGIEIHEEALMLHEEDSINTYQKLLLVEDNEVNRKLLIKFLERYGITCDVAVNGLEAVEKVKVGDYDLVFMDCHMPIKGGMEATKEIRAFNETVDIYAMTAYASQEDYQKCMDAGMNGFYTKPIDMGEVAKLLNFSEAYTRDQMERNKASQEVVLKDMYIDELEKNLGFDRETCEDLIITYINQAKDIFLEIEGLIKDENYVEIGHKLHQLKGASGAVRLESIRKKVEKAEKLIKGELYSESIKLIRGLSKEPIFEA